MPCPKNGRDPGDWPYTLREMSSYARFFVLLLAITQLTLAASLSGSGQYTGAGHNLTALGNIDWAAWGDGGSGSIIPTNRKSGGGSLIQASLVGTIITFNNSTNTNGGLFWTDGTPTPSQLAPNGVETSDGIGGGYKLTFPASTTPHTVYLFMGGRNNFPIFTASLSDGSAPTYTNNSLGASAAPFNTMFVLTYSANSNGQTLTVTYTNANNASDVTLDAAAYGTVAPASGGSISGSVTTQTTQTNNLTSLGTADWAQWGHIPASTTSPSNTRNNGGNTIRAQAINGTVTQFSGASVSVAWTDGTPNATGTDASGIYANSGEAGDGFLMTFPADTNLRTLSIILGGNKNAGQLGVALTDGSAPEYLDASQSSSNGPFYALYTITYKAASAGQSLIVSWVQLNTGFHVSLSGAAYALNAAQCPSPCVAAATVSSPFGGSATSAPVDTTGATLYVLTLSSFDNLGTATVTSSPSQTWTALNRYSNSHDGTGNGVMYYVCGPATSASQAITVTGDYATAVFAAYSGTATSNCFDSPNQNGNITYNGGSTFQPGSITPSQNGALIVSGLGANSSASSVSIDSGFTIVGTYAGTHFSSQAFQVQPSASSINPTWTESSDGHAVPYIASFLPTAHPNPPASVTATVGTPQSATVNTAFAAALQATVKDDAGNPVSGVTVTFSAPASGAGASFGGSATAAVTTNASGIATAPVLTANSQAGSYSVAASVSGVSTPASFSLTNVAGPPASIAATSGTQQSATVNTAFATALQATVKDAYNNPLSGVNVLFTVPSTGASASFGGSKTATAATNASGVATAPVLTANAQAGSYIVAANIPGVAATAPFSLTNTAVPPPPPAPASISTNAGTPQSTSVSTQFGTVLQALVKDNNGNPFSNATVTFTAPGSGASAAFSGSATATAVTNSSGIASAPALTANSQTGSYTVTATVAGVSAPANFLLTNTAVGPASSVNLIQQATGTNLGNNGNTLTVTLPHAPDNSDVLVLIFDQTGASQTITSITGATWTRVGQNTSSGGDLEIWTGTSPTSSTITVTGTNYFGLFQPGYAIVTEFSGITATLDGSAITTSAGIWPVTTGALTTTNAGDLLLTAVLSYSGGGSNASVSSGWSLLAPPPGTYSLAAAFKAVNTTGPSTATWAGNGTPQAPSIILALKASGSSSSTTTTISALAGTPQSTTVNTAFSSPLQATVTSAGSPVSGATVTFSAPVSGASASFSGSVTATATTNASGIATAPVLTADSTTGSYTVTASVVGVSAAASFSLTNSGGPTPAPTPATISTSAGTPQSTAVGTQFGTVLQALVKDNNGNPYSNATVTFTAPGSGASAVFSGSATATAVTNSSGIASAPALTANSQTGTYTVTATVAGVSAAANFLLTNTAVGAVSSASLIQQATGTNLGNNGNTLSVTLPRAPDNSDVLVLIFDQTGASQTITSITGATWTRVGQNTSSAGDLEIWTGTSPTSSTITVTGTNYFGGFQPGYAIVAEFSGITATLDGSPATTAGGIWPVTTGTLTTTNAGDLLLTAVLSYSGGGTAASVNSGWTLLTAPPGTYSLAAAFQSVNTTGSHAATWNGNGTPQAPSIILALK